MRLVRGDMEKAKDVPDESREGTTPTYATNGPSDERSLSWKRKRLADKAVELWFAVMRCPITTGSKAKAR